MMSMNSGIKMWHCAVSQKTHIYGNTESWGIWSAESSRKPTKFIYLISTRKLGAAARRALGR
jgi:hypothetical protein